MPKLTAEETYWGLVHQLMGHGWYRVGQGPAADDGRTQWGFREGHLRDVPSAVPLWIPACDEGTAMRILLSEIESAAVDRAARARYTVNASLTELGIPDPALR